MKTLIVKADNSHIDQIAALLIITSYDIASAKYNTLGTDAFTYIKEYKVKPLMPFIYVAVDFNQPERVLGLLSAGPLSLIMNCSQKSYSHPETKKIFKKFYDIHEKDIPESYYIFRFAVNKNSRNSGVGNILFEHAQNEAKIKGFSKLTLVVWSSQIDAIRFYLRKDMEIKKIYHISDELPYPNLLYLEKDFNKKLIKNYFESDDFFSLNLV